MYVRDCKCALCSCSCYGKNNPENIIKALKSVIEKNLKIKWDDFVSKLVALYCDRASVNTGQKGGVGALLKTEQPDLIVLHVHCMAHRLELSIKDVLKKVPLYRKVVDTLLKGLFYFYHNSPLNNAMLHRTYALKENGNKLLHPTRTDGTRLVGHQLLAVTNVLTSYKFIVGHLEQVK